MPRDLDRPSGNAHDILTSGPASHQTDDVGIFGSPLSNEYRLVAKNFGLSVSEIRALARKGIDVIFGGEEEKQRLRRIMDASQGTVS